MKRFGILVAAAIVGSLLGATAEAQEIPKMVEKDGAKTQEGATLQDGKWVLPDGTITYNVKGDGTLDWYTYSGFRRYHSECHVCHGPEGEGSTYAPALTESLKKMDYNTFLGIVASGQKRSDAGTDYIMPALGDNKNVMCYIEDIYTYLKARADGAMPRGRPAGRTDKPPQAVEFEKACFAG